MIAQVKAVGNFQHLPEMEEIHGKGNFKRHKAARIEKKNDTSFGQHTT